MTTVDEMLQAARDKLERVSAEDLADEIANGAIVIDTRPVDQRERDGELEGAIVIDRNVLEWRVAESSPWRTVEPEPGQKVIVFCTDGYSSSLAAANLQDLGVEGATDLIGGYRSLLGDPTEGG